MSDKLPEINRVIGVGASEIEEAPTDTTPLCDETHFTDSVKSTDSANIRYRIKRQRSRKSESAVSIDGEEEDIVIVSKPENEIEAQRIANNYLVSICYTGTETHLGLKILF